MSLKVLAFWFVSGNDIDFFYLKFSGGEEQLWISFPFQHGTFLTIKKVLTVTRWSS